MPWENNHYNHDGNPSLETFSCNISGGSEGDLEIDVSPSCELVDLITEDIKGVETNLVRHLPSSQDA